MQEELVSFETAKLAKEKGFDLKVDSIYSEYSNNSIIIDNSHLKKYNKFSKTEYIENKNWNKSNKFTSAPTQSLLQKWLREVYNTHLMVEPFYNEQKVLVYGLDLITERIEEETIVEKGFKTYEEALEVGLQEALKLIEIVKEK
jgi:hypothetical protein